MTGTTPGAHTLFRWIADRARVSPDTVAIDDRGVTTTYGELHRGSQRLADTLAGTGYGRGDRIATLTGNSTDHIELFLACAELGIALVPLSWRLSAVELADQLVHADPHLVVLEDAYAELGRSALDRLPTPPNVVEFAEIDAPPQRSSTEPPLTGPAQDDDPVLVLFTSGSSGMPKAAQLTQANCFWNNLSFSRTLPLDEEDVVLVMLPQFHAGGWNIQTLLALWVGATIVLERSFDAGRVLHLIEERRVTTFMGVPTNYQLLADHADFASTDLSSLGTVVVGGAPMPVPLLRTWHARNVRLCQGYGLTEASPNVLCLPAKYAESRAGSAGKPYPFVDVAVADPATGDLLDGEATGELLVGGPGVFAGYFRAPETTARVRQGEWLRTGDMVHRDTDGFYTIVDRIKDMYISGGENVSPTEVEAALRLHPGVDQVAVIGVADERWGEVGKAFVVQRAEAAVTVEELTGHCRERLARYKIPKHIEFVDALPYNAMNKIRRFSLRDAEATHRGTGETTSP
jgi:fatty-acyl-CoA synthase